MTNQQLHERRSQVIAQGMGALYPLYVEKAENAYVWDIEGNKYIDFAAGIAVTNTGHSHKRISEAVKAQLDNFSHTCAMVTPYASFVELAEKLTELAPGETKKKAIFLTTGAEAVENAVKVARAHTGRSGVIAFKGGFHGRTNMTMGLTGKVAPYKAALVLSRMKSTTRHTQMRSTASVWSKAYKRSTIYLLAILNLHALRRSSSSQCKARAASTKHLKRLHKAYVNCVISTVSC